MGRVRIGREGEEAAAGFLLSRGYRLLHRNYRCGRFGELDIVALDGDTLVFVEVKTRRSAKYGTGAEAVGRRKQERLLLLARWYIAAERVGDRPCRFDVVEVDAAGKGMEPRLIQGAFWE
jgi:putative endonuclease